MSDPAVKKLQKRYYKRYCEYVNWPLSRSITIGDIGKWSSGKMFSRENNLSDYDLKLKPSTRRGGAIIKARAFTSEGGVGLKFKASGDMPYPSTALVQAKAGVSIALKARYACVLRAKALEEETVENFVQFEKQLIGLGKDEAWWKHRVVISAVLRAKAATVALSHSIQQRVDINAGVKTMVPFDIADTGLKLELGYQGSDTSVDLLAIDPIVAFQITKLRKGNWWHSWTDTQVFLTS
ncbi:hypothetical protein KA005_24390 [bacterium]|nr:hypothetical protein [bacterium]